MKDGGSGGGSWDSGKNKVFKQQKKKIEVGKSMPHLETATISKVGVHSATDNRRP